MCAKDPFSFIQSHYYNVHLLAYEQEFEHHILDDSRSSSLDKGNIKLAYESVSITSVAVNCGYKSSVHGPYLFCLILYS